MGQDRERGRGSGWWEGGGECRKQHPQPPQQQRDQHWHDTDTKILQREETVGTRRKKETAHAPRGREYEEEKRLPHARHLQAVAEEATKGLVRGRVRGHQALGPVLVYQHPAFAGAVNVQEV
jgi:hypothetical protein